MPEQASANGQPKIGFTSTMLVQVAEVGVPGSTQAIKVEVDEALVSKFLDKGSDQELMKAYFEQRVTAVITLYRLLGLSLIGLKKFTITTYPLPGAAELVSFNEELFTKLRPRPPERVKLTPLLQFDESVEHGRLTFCAEDERGLWFVDPEP